MKNRCFYGFLKKYRSLLILLLLPANLILIWNAVSDRIKVNRIEKQFSNPAIKFFKIIPLKKDSFFIYDELHPDALCVGNSTHILQFQKNSNSIELICADLKNPAKKISLSALDSGAVYLYRNGFFWNDFNGDGLFDLKLKSDLSENYIHLNGEWKKCIFRNGKTAFLKEHKEYHFNGSLWLLQNNKESDRYETEK